MKVVIGESVFLFLKENRIELSQQLKIVVSHLKINPRMYAMITDDKNIRHFVIKGVDFGYIIVGNMIIILDYRFIKLNTKLK